MADPSTAVDYWQVHDLESKPVLQLQYGKKSKILMNSIKGLF
jgi:hypothetical protein